MEKGQQPNKKLKQAYRISYLFAAYIKQTLTAAEQEELNAWIRESDQHLRLFTELTDKQNIDQAMKYFQRPDLEENLKSGKLDKEFIHPPKLIRLRPFFLIAASLLAVIALIYFFSVSSRKRQDQPLANATNHEILPAKKRVILTLGDGRQVILPNEAKDSVINTQVAVKGNSKELVYSGAGPVVYNTVSVPAGNGYAIELADGSVVHLNSVSTLRYPTSFQGDTRKVELTGEAFFEVAHDEKRKFIVETPLMMIEDLGTSFNINAYSNEPSVTTTLLTGSVKISPSAGGQSVILKPGQQSMLSRHGLQIKDSVNMETVTAWKNGWFRFINTELTEIMRQAERLYGVEVEYQDKVDVHLNAAIPRNVPASKLLHLLSQTGEAHFKIDVNKIIVSK